MPSHEPHTSKMEPVRIGILGYGNAARVYHIPYIIRNPHLVLHAICQRAPAPAPGEQPDKPHCTIDHPDVKHYDNVEAFLSDPEIELVSVVTGNDGHIPLAEKALLAGKHVIVEKPFACSTQDADRAIATAAKCGKLLTPFQSRRYDSDFQTLLQVVQAGHLGEITDAEIHYDLDLPSWMRGMTDPGWKPGDGLNFGIGCHSLDQALCLFGRPKSITAFYRTLRGVQSESEDTFDMTLQYADSPRLVHVKTHVRTTLPNPLKYFVRGNEGTFIKYGDDQQEHQIMRGMKPWDEGFGQEPEEIWAELTTRKQVLPSQQQKGSYWVGRVPSANVGIRQYYTDVAKAVRGQGAHVVEASMSRDGLRIIELARKSALEGVTVPFDL